MRHFSLTVLSDFMASTIEYCWLYLITHFSDFQLASFGSFFLHEGVFFLSGLPFIFFERAGVLSKYKIQHKNNTPAAQEKCIVRLLLYHFCVNLPVMIFSYPVFRYMGLSSSLPLPSWKVVLVQIIFYFILEDFVFYWGHRILHTKWLYKHVHSVHHELLWKSCLSCSTIILAPVKNSSAFLERNYMWGSSSVALPFKKFITANLSQRVVWMSALEKGPLTLYWKLDEVLSWQFVRYATPFGLTSEYAHPAEILFLGFATIIGPAITGPHLLTLWLWMTLRVLETVEAHSGYHFPWSLSNLFPLYGGADFHDYHHRLLYTKSGNYSSTFVYMDWIFGTDKGYRKFKALMRD